MSNDGRSEQMDSRRRSKQGNTGDLVAEGLLDQKGTPSFNPYSHRYHSSFYLHFRFHQEWNG
uniref:Uncharacterized protein n=1 Tax=Helianthus annuus TaxID=4232 RepID=A0A251TT06_HELAN